MYKICLLLLLLPTLTFAKTVAVLDFQNNTGKDSLQFLAFSLAETINNTIARDRELQTIERTQIKKIFKELNFQFTSRSKIFNNANTVIDLKDFTKANPGSLKKIELLNADYLIIGSYQGTSEISIIIRAVQVSSGKIITSVKVDGSIENIFPKVEEATLRIAAYLKGKKLYCLSVNSYPSGADVYINDYKIGTTPIACHNVPSGKHDISIVKTGYQKHTEQVQLSDKNKDVTITLLDMALGYRTGLAFGYYYFNSKNFSQAQDRLFSFKINQSFNFLQASLEYAQTMGKLEYEYDYKVPYGTHTEKRTAITYQANLLLSVIPFNSLFYVTPYFGMQTGYCHLLEIGVKSEYFGDRKKGHDLYTLGGFAGLLFLPYSKISIYTEIRYIKSYIHADREVITSVSFGRVSKDEKQLNLDAYQIGCGINFYF